MGLPRALRGRGGFDKLADRYEYCRRWHDGFCQRCRFDKCAEILSCNRRMRFNQTNNMTFRRILSTFSIALAIVSFAASSRAAALSVNVQPLAPGTTVDLS